MEVIYIPTTWEYSISVPFEKISDYLSDQDYIKYKNEYLRLHVLLEYENNPGDDEIGLEPSFDLTGWDAIDKYPESIMNALEEHLQNESEKYSNMAYEKLCDFIDYQKYGEY